MKKKTKSVFSGKFFVAACMILVILSGMTVSVYAAETDYYLTDNSLYLQFMPKSYTVEDVILSIELENPEAGIEQVLDSPQDIFVDEMDNIYIADTGNKRIIKLSPENKLLGVYPEVGDEEAQLGAPEGIFVDKDGDMYIADVINRDGNTVGRIVHLSPDGKFIEEFLQPTEETYDAAYPFLPSKVYIDEYGIIYAINKETYHGIITMNARGNFLGYVGAQKIGYDFVMSLVRLFASDIQIRSIFKITPPHYLNLTINGDGTMYVSTAFAKLDQIKRLTPSGSNVFPSRTFGESNGNEKTYKFLPSFIDLAVNKQGIVFTVDRALGMLYIIDQKGNHIAAFGGIEPVQRNFDGVSSIAVNSKNELYVLNGIMGNIQVLKPTDFMKNVLEAVTLSNAGKYDLAQVPWANVLEMDSSYKLAQSGVAKTYLRAGENGESLDMYKKAYDKEGYSDAFEIVRMQTFRDNFILISFILIVGVSLLMFLIMRARRYSAKVVNASIPKVENDKHGIVFFAQTSLGIIFNPIDTFYRIKQNRKNLKFWPIILFLGILVIEKLLYRQIIHFPLNDSPIYIDYFRDLATFFIPLICWMIVAYALTSISDGKQTFMETISCTLYAFIPFMILYLPFAAITNIMSIQDAGMYNGLQVGLMSWCFILVFLNLKILNEYSFFRAIFNIIKIIFGIICLLVIILMFYIIIVQFMHLISEVSVEFIYMNKAA